MLMFSQCLQGDYFQNTRSVQLSCVYILSPNPTITQATRIKHKQNLLILFGSLQPFSGLLYSLAWRIDVTFHYKTLFSWTWTELLLRYNTELTGAISDYGAICLDMNIDDTCVNLSSKNMKNLQHIQKKDLHINNIQKTNIPFNLIN